MIDCGPCIQVPSTSDFFLVTSSNSPMLVLQLAHARFPTCLCQFLLMLFFSSNLLMTVLHLAHADPPTCSCYFSSNLLMAVLQLAHAISSPTCSCRQFSNLLMPSVLQIVHASSSPFSIGYHILPCNSRYTSHPLVM